MIGMLAGISVGILMGPSVGWLSTNTAAIASDWLAFPGKLFLALIHMMVVPLVFASIIRGLAATEDLDQLRKIGLRAGLYFLATTVLAIVIGLGVASWIKPGQYINSETLYTVEPTLAASTDGATTHSININDLPQKIVTLLPSNPLTSMVENNMMQVVIFAMVMGIALVMMKAEQAKPLLDLMGSLQEVCMTVVR